MGALAELLEKLYMLSWSMTCGLSLPSEEVWPRLE